MAIVLLYLVTVLVWGTSWYAIKLEVGTVPPEVSVAYRFALAAVCLFVWAILRRVPLALPLRLHARVLLLGILLFGVNLTLLYYASQTLTSGLVSVVFSTITVMNIVNARIALGNRTPPIVWVGAALGVAGLALIFRLDIAALVSGRDAARTAAGFGFCLAGTYVASLGNIWAVRVQSAGASLVQSTAWGMGYGAAALFLFALLRGENLAIARTLPYLAGLAYLAVFASVIGFTSYLTLLRRIGPERAGYTAVAFPVVALAVSALLENFVLTMDTAIGGAVVLFGNVLVLRRPKA